MMLLLALAMAGCVQTRTEWSKPGQTQAEYDKDSYECERDTRVAAATFTNREDMKRFVYKCMESKGWTPHEITS